MSALEVIALDPVTPQLRAPGAGDSYLLPRSVEITETFNNAGVTFTALKLNITDTASAAGSLLMDLQVGGSSKFSVAKDGSIQFATAGTAYAANIRVGLNNEGIYLSSSGFGFSIDTDTPIMSCIWNLGLAVTANNYFAWGDTFNATTGHNLRLYKDAANTLAQRNGTNAQTSRLYGTYTDASNYRRLTQTMSMAGVAEIKPEGAGTGASGNVLHISGLPTSNPGAGILWNDNGTVKVGT